MSAHKTAIKRKAPSAPMKRLASHDLIKGRAMDYGCGKGYDACEYNMESYDPHYQPNMPDGMFDTITCNYVLNVIESKVEKLHVLRVIRGKLKRGGTAYITVRNDRRALTGKTSKGTYQCHVILRLRVVYSCSGYVTYELGWDDTIDNDCVEHFVYVQ